MSEKMTCPTLARLQRDEDAYIASYYCPRGGPDEYAVYRYGANGAARATAPQSKEEEASNGDN